MEETRVCGTVNETVYKNEDSGYAVAKVLTDEGDIVTVVGNMPNLGAGEYLEAEGEYVSHPNYGRQFSVRRCVRRMPDSANGIFEYLAAGSIKGIGIKTAEAICERFGGKAFDIIANHPERLSEIRGISYERALIIQENYLRSGAMRAVVEFLASHRLPPHFASPLIKRYGGDTVSTLTEDPYILCFEPFLLSFADCDALAADFGIGADDDVRLEAALCYELFYNLQSGHVFIPAEKLTAVASRLCGASEELLWQSLYVLESEQRIVRRHIGKADACYLASVYREEVLAARHTRRLLEMTVKPPANLGKLLSAQEKKSGLTYAERQREAIKLCFSSAISIITGGPGTGKTTALLTLIDMLDACGMSSLLAAPTGRAADRMSKICGRDAKTLHRLLEAAPDDWGEMSFKRNFGNQLDADVIIVDEASMLDLHMSASLLDALKPHTRLVLVGDADQLPPVGAGSFFCDLLESGKVPCVRLNEVFRQAQTSDIIVNAHKINHGEVPPLRKNTGDFYFSSCRTAQAAANLAADLVSRRIPEHFGIAPGDIQVICPSRRNACGTEVLNVLLQRQLNPEAEGKNEIKFGTAVFRDGDRVMQIRNNYDRVWYDPGQSAEGAGIYNGDTGIVRAVDERAKLLTVAFDRRLSEYSLGDLDEIEHAFAITAHKSQGSEYSAVIIPVFDCPPRLLSRNLLYTAVTRAKELLVLVGREDMIETMIVSGETAKRYGALRRRICCDVDE